MTKIDIISGFLGAGKTTLIKKLIEEGFKGEKLVLIENEFGEIGIDGGFLKDAGVQITEMNSGCICCSLVGDFGTALKKVITEYAPDTEGTTGDKEKDAGLKIELDVFEGLYQGLIYAEVEFETKEDADNFAAPAWFTRDVSMDGAYHNSALSSMNEEQRLAFMARVFGH